MHSPGLLLDALGVDLSAARCRGYDSVLITIVHSGERSWVGLGGLAAVEVRSL